jgi:hypothetical protein
MGRDGIIRLRVGQRYGSLVSDHLLGILRMRIMR